MTNDEDLVTPRLRTMQLLAAALPGGVVIFMGIALFLVANRPEPGAPEGPFWLSWLAVGFVALQAVVVAVFAPLQTRSAVRRAAAGAGRPPDPSLAQEWQTDTARPLAIAQTQLLITLALLEGAAFFGCVAYLVEAQPIALAAAAVALVVMLARFPTEARLHAWLEQQSETLDRYRQEEPHGDR
jgi:hypothetical protein